MWPAVDLHLAIGGQQHSLTLDLSEDRKRPASASGVYVGKYRRPASGLRESMPAVTTSSCSEDRTSPQAGAEVGLQSKFRSGKISRENLGTVFVFMRNKAFLPWNFGGFLGRVSFATRNESKRSEIPLNYEVLRNSQVFKHPSPPEWSLLLYCTFPPSDYAIILPCTYWIEPPIVSCIFFL